MAFDSVMGNVFCIYYIDTMIGIREYDAVIAETEHSISDHVEILPFSVLTDIEIMPYTEHISFSGV